MKTFKEFITESKRLKFARYYHGTPESAEKQIKKSGFKTPEVYASTSRETARAFGSRYAGGKNVKTMSFRVPKKSVKSEAPGKVVKTTGQRGIDKWGREHHTVVMDPEYAKKHISKEREGVINSPKIPKEFRDRLPKNSRFKLRTKTQPKKK
jgi:hypothetical protein